MMVVVICAQLMNITLITNIVIFSRVIDTFETQMLLISNDGDYKTFLLYKEQYFEISELIDIFEEKCKYVQGL
jgi:hypothetical protein